MASILTTGQKESVSSRSAALAGASSPWEDLGEGLDRLVLDRRHPLQDGHRLHPSQGRRAEGVALLPGGTLDAQGRGLEQQRPGRGLAGQGQPALGAFQGQRGDPLVAARTSGAQVQGQPSSWIQGARSGLAMAWIASSSLSLACQPGSWGKRARPRTRAALAFSIFSSAA